LTNRVEATDLNLSEMHSSGFVTGETLPSNRSADTMFRLAVACDWITVCIRYRGYDIGNQPSVEWLIVN
jgi:hypothetical protein